MATNIDYANGERSRCKSVQTQNQAAAEGSQTPTILADLLRSMENQLTNRGLLIRGPHDQFNPVWYLAEMERNVFLWKRGCSLIQQDEFEFWVDIPRLVQKRISQLENVDYSNPLTNSMWGLASISEENYSREREYLITFLALVYKIQEHAAALCEASRIILGPTARKEKVVLPTTRAPKGALVAD